MPRYTDDSKERVRDAVDMVDLVGSRVELRKSGGSTFNGLCPFHDERTPSLSVDAAKKLYHCFGCDAGGDAFTFVQQLDGLDFVGALEFLADRYKVPLEVAEESPGAAMQRERRERLLELLERAATFYLRMLWESPEAEPAREYLRGRGLDEAVLREFRVGYAPSPWDKMLLASRRAGFGDREIYDAGLSQRGREGKVYDRFRRRIMFPLADRRGRVLGFGARALGADQQPKYLNTAETELFVKGRQLFGADVARAHAARAGSVIVAEGYTDVIAMHQVGMRNAVGIMGTAMTPEQVEALAGLAPTALLALDADSAGQEAMLRAAKVAVGRKIELRVVPLPVGSDPADLVAEQGGPAMAALVDASVPFVRFRVERVLAGATRDAEGKDRVLAELRPVFADLAPSVMRQELQHLVADSLDIPEGLVAEMLAAGPARGGGGGGAAKGPAPAQATNGSRAVSRGERTERNFLALCIALPAQGHEALDRVTPEHFSTPLLARAVEHLRVHLAAPTEGVPEEDHELVALMTELSMRAARGRPTRESLRVEALQLELSRLDRAIAHAGSGEPGQVTGLAASRTSVKAELDAAIDAALEASATPGESSS